MSNTFLERRRPTGLYVVIAGLAVALVVAVGVIVITATGAKQTPAPEPGALSGAGASPAPARQAPLRLVRGNRQVNGVNVGYPHTYAGAVSAAVEYWTQIASALEPSRAATIGRTVAAASWTTATTELAQGPVNTRRSLGLPLSGPVPEGASVTLSVASYQLRNPGADQVTVLLLADYIVTLPSVGPDTRTGVFPMQLRWSGCDWKMPNAGPDTDYSALSTEPGSPQAAALGWQLFQR